MKCRVKVEISLFTVDRYVGESTADAWVMWPAYAPVSFISDVFLERTPDIHLVKVE